jgi:WHG domain-containing protein
LADLVEAGVAVFRRFALEHASLFRLAVQQTVATPELTGQARPAAAAAMAGLKARIERLAEAGLLGGRTVEAAACEFHAVCEGLAAIELRGVIHDGEEAPIWRDALGAFVAGLARTPSTLTPGAS